MRRVETSPTSPARPYTPSVLAVGIGAIAVALVAAPYKVFDLDRYFIPKELVLHLTASVAIVALLLDWGRATRRTTRKQVIPMTRTDTLLVAFIVLSALSAFWAPNGWLASRTLAVSVSGISLFWVTQTLARAGRERALMALLAGAVTVVAATALLQAYGVESEYFSINRSPGGTLGNRNFIAHLAIIGMPTIIVATLRSRRGWAVVPGAVATAIVAAALVLSRSRAAWVAAPLCAICVLPTVMRAWPTARTQGSRPSKAAGATRQRQAPITPSASIRASALMVRGAILTLSAIAGICAAIALPNTLNWRSAFPYLDSVVGVTNYRGGSGHGRLVQYANTARLAITHPVLGVGPGNWAVAYPHVAPRNDPSLDPDDGMTANPWPSSDWAAFASERGLPATICLALALVGVLVGAGRAADVAVQSRAVDLLLPALALTATVVALIVVGAFDAVLLLPAPSLLAWSILGTLAGTLVPAPATRTAVPVPPAGRTVLIAIVVVAGGLALARSVAQVAAMALYESATTTGAGDHALELAARADPGSYRIQVRLAEAYLLRRSCVRARSHATAARSLFPSAPEPRRVLLACGGRGR